MASRRLPAQVNPDASLTSKEPEDPTASLNDVLSEVIYEVAMSTSCRTIRDGLGP